MVEDESISGGTFSYEHYELIRCISVLPNIQECS